MGKAVFTPGALTCADCEPGTQTNSIGSPVCISCAGGKKENGLRTGCIDCEAGKMSNPGNDTCTTCDHLSGYIATGVGNEQCEYCGPGFKADQTIHDCVPCEAGKHSVGGVNECLTCDATEGKVQGLEGQSSCEYCGAGKKATAGTTNACLSCQKGEASLGGSNTCSPCDGEGEYSDVTGGAVCKIAPPGSVPSAARDGTDLCPAGKFSASGASSESGCEECVNGEYSAAGAAYCSTVGAGKQIVKVNGLRVGVSDCEANTFSTGANDTCARCEGGHSEAGSSSCIDTPPGHYFNVTLHIDSPCPAGRFSKTGASNIADCTPCTELGSYSPPGSAFCLFSPAGHIAASNRTGTIACPSGSVSGIGQDKCKECEVGKFTNGTDRTECKFCDKENAVIGSTTGQKGSSEVSSCICPKSKYKKVADVKYPTCVDVPEGVSVSIDGMDRYNLHLEKGFFRVSNESLEVLPCENTASCEGGYATGNALCKRGSTGKLCSVCDKNFATVGIGPMKQCVECEGSKTATLAAFGTFISVCLLVIVYFFYREYNRDIAESESLRDSTLAATNMAMKKSKQAKKFMAKAGPVIKILIAYSQIVSNFGSSFDIKFPPMFNWLMGIFSAIANLDFINFMPLDCIFRSNYDQKMFAYTGFPVAVGVLIWILLLLLSKSEKQHHIHFSNWLFSIYLLGTFAVLPSATLKIASTFSCRTFDVADESVARWLKADYSINCSSNEHKVFMLIAGIMALLYPLGIPLQYIWELYKTKGDINPGVGQNRMVNTKVVKYKITIDNESTTVGYIVGTANGDRGGEDGETFKIPMDENDFIVATLEEISEAIIKIKSKKRSLEEELAMNVGTQDDLTDALSRIQAEVITLDEEEAMKCAIFLRDLREAKNRKMKRLRFLYVNYEPSCWWFEIFETLRRLTLTAGISFLNPGTASQILFSILLSLGAMRVYAEYKPFIDPKLDRLSEAMAWQTFFMMLASLAVKVNLDGENLDDKMWFDVMLIVINFSGPAVLLVKQWYDGGTKEMLKQNVDAIGVIMKAKESIDEGVKETKAFKKAWGASSKQEEVEMTTLGQGDSFGQSDEMQYSYNPTTIGGREMGSGRDIRGVSVGEVGLGGEVVSKHEKYQKRADEARKEQLKQAGYHRSKSNRVPSVPRQKKKTAWEKKFDDATGCYYYYNSEMGVSEWDKPDDFRE